MTEGAPSDRTRLFRVASIVVPSWGAWYVAFTHRSSSLGDAVTYTFGPLWALVALGLLLRGASAAFAPRRDGVPAPLLHHLDLLTGRGSALAWSSAIAVVLAVVTGYASLAVVGVLGAVLTKVCVLRVLLTLRGRDPMRASAIARWFSPEGGSPGEDPPGEVVRTGVVATAGEPVVEHVRVRGARIPLGFRLFMTGCVGPRWATSRYVLDASESEADVALASEVGPAVRGEHEPAPLSVWLEDVFGLCRSPRVAVGSAPFAIGARERRIDGRMLTARGEGAGPSEPRPTVRPPSEGLFDLREYRSGDDVRRVHWTRSALARKLIVRVPDEVPPDRPRVRVVLDTYWPVAGAFESDVPAVTLDALVSVWLSAARALASSGVRVTLVTAAPACGGVVPVRQELSVRDGGAQAARLSARAAWQGALPLEELLTTERTLVVARAGRAPIGHDPRVRWLLVGAPVPEPPRRREPVCALPHPLGTPENRRAHRVRASRRRSELWMDRVRAILALGGPRARLPAGTLGAIVVDPDADEIPLEVLA